MGQREKETNERNGRVGKEVTPPHTYIPRDYHLIRAVDARRGQHNKVTHHSCRFRRAHLPTAFWQAEPFHRNDTDTPAVAKDGNVSDEKSPSAM